MSNIRKDIQSLSPGAVIELFMLDLTSLGGPISYFHAGTNSLRGAVVWQGNSYTPWPIYAEGFDYNGRGQLPTPRLRVANIAGAITALALAYNDMIGAKLTRKRTFARYLDGQPTADPSAQFPDDMYFVERKVSESKMMLEYELSSAMDVEGVKIPGRQITATFCSWRYRSSECGYVGGAVAKIDDTPTVNLSEDNCSRRQSGCELRFGNDLPFGGFPAVLRV